MLKRTKTRVAVLETGQNSSKIDENTAKIMELFGGELIEDGGT